MLSIYLTLLVFGRLDIMVLGNAVGSQHLQMSAEKWWLSKWQLRMNPHIP